MEECGITIKLAEGVAHGFEDFVILELAGEELPQGEESLNDVDDDACAIEDFTCNNYKTLIRKLQKKRQKNIESYCNILTSSESTSIELSSAIFQRYSLKAKKKLGFLKGIVRK